MKSIYQVIRDALLERGWRIDHAALEWPDGELREFVHPETGERMAYIDAVFAEQGLELTRGDSS